MNTGSIVISVFIIILVVLAGYLLFGPREALSPRTSTSFEECVSAGYPVLESYPRQCRTPEGENFVEDIGNELEKRDVIVLHQPRPNDMVTSPLRLEGMARGRWFFEGSFPIRLLDEHGNEIASAITQAQGEWMTEEFVPFSADIEFISPDSAKGSLILEKALAKDEEDGEYLRVPVRFE